MMNISYYIYLCIYNVTVFTLIYIVSYIKLMYWWQGRRKQLESGEAKQGVISISIQEVLCSYLIVAEGNSAAKGSSC